DRAVRPVHAGGDARTEDSAIEVDRLLRRGDDDERAEGGVALREVCAHAPSVPRVLRVGLEHPRQGGDGAVLWPAAGADVFDTGRLPPPAPLDDVAAYYWWVTWRRAERVPFR